MKNILENNNIEFQDKEKYYTTCPLCHDKRHSKDTQSLMVTADNGYVRWKCLHAEQCEWNKLQTYKVGGEVVDKVEVKAAQILIEEGNIPPHATDSILYNYKDIEGNIMFYVIRTKDKKFCPMTYTEDGEWTARAWKGTSLYGAENLKNSNVVIVVEGEKTKDAAQKIFTKAAVVSWIGGASNINKGDWDLLEGKEIILWPDNDDAGIKAMRKIAGILSSEDLSIVDVTSLPPKHDLADNIDTTTISNLYENRVRQAVWCIEDALTIEDYLSYVHNATPGLPMGFDNMDKTTTLPESGLTIILGRTGHGKTALMINIATNMLRKTDRKVVYYSYEVTKEQTNDIFVKCMHGKQMAPLPADNIRLYRDAIKKRELPEVTEIGKYIKEGRFILTDKRDPLSKLISQLDNRHFEDSVVFIDYIQLVNNDHTQSRYLAIKDTAERLRELANKRKMVIITGSQLTAGETPYQDVAREGKDIEFSASLMLKVWNKIAGKAQGAFKAKKAPKEDGGGDIEEDYYDDIKGDFVITITKNRHGEPNRKYGFNLKFGAKLEISDESEKYKEF